MRQLFIPFCDAETFDEAEGVAPWACKIVEVEDGWLAFESADDYYTWGRQI